MPSKLSAKLTANRPRALRPPLLKQVVAKVLVVLREGLCLASPELREDRLRSGRRYPTTPPITLYPRRGYVPAEEGGGDGPKLCELGVGFVGPADYSILTGSPEENGVPGGLPHCPLFAALAQCALWIAAVGTCIFFPIFP